MGILLKINTLFRKLEEYIISFSIIIMAIMLVGNALSRSIFNRSWSFTEEIGQLLVVIVTFIGTSYAARIDRHINMTAIFDLVSFKKKKIFLYVISGVTAIAMFYLAYLSFSYVYAVYFSARITPALRIPMWTMYSFVPLGFLMTGFQYLLNFILNVRDQENLYLGTEKVFHISAFDNNSKGNNESNESNENKENITVGSCSI